jgi:hypothetical protein
MLHRAIDAAKAGRKVEARQLLEQLLAQDGSNEMAWLWMGAVVETDADRLFCLENVVSINPGNERARRGVERLQASTQPQGFPAPSVPGSAMAAEAQRMPQMPRAAHAAERPSSTDQALRLVAGLLVGVVAAIFAYLIVSSLLGSGSNGSDAQGNPAVSQEGLAWQQLASPDKEFVIKMPGTPKTDVQDVPTAVGVVQLHTFTVDKGDSVYLVGYGDYPESLVRNADVSAMLDGARDGALANSGGTLIAEQQIQLQGYPGRELWIEATVEGEKGLARARMYLVGARLYQVLVGGSNAHFSESAAETFLNSFLLVR